MWFNNIVLAIKGLIANYLHRNLSFLVLRYEDDGNILGLFLIYCNLQDKGEICAVLLRDNLYEVDFVVEIKIEVVDPGFLEVQGLLEFFYCL